MHPGFFGWWRHGHVGHPGPGAHAACGPAACGPRAAHHAAERFAGYDEDGGGFGVRRPLRFLAHKLELRDEQVAELAIVLSELKTERAQAAVDERRATSTLADAVAESTFDAAKVAAAGAERVRSAERLRDAVARALARIHALLDDDQRKRLAYLLRTGTLSI